MNRLLIVAVMIATTILSNGQSKTARPVDAAAPLVDHHQHLFSPAMAAVLSTPDAPFKPISADDLVPLLDAAGIKRAVVLSTAYIYGQPRRKVENEYDKVRAENDWTSQQVARYPDRLIGFCSFNPLRDFAFDELARCAKDPNLKTGLKLHFGNSAIDYHDAKHIERLRQIFRAANGYKMAIVVHMRPSVSLKTAYGRDEALIFLNELVPAAPDVPIQIAHLGGTNDYAEDVPADPALLVFIEAIKRGDPRTKHLWFDVTTAAKKDATPEQAKLVATRIRQLGVKRVLYGSDAATPGNSPLEGWKVFRQLPLSEKEFRTIAANVAPYIRRVPHR